LAEVPFDEYDDYDDFGQYPQIRTKPNKPVEEPKPQGKTKVETRTPDRKATIETTPESDGIDSGIQTEKMLMKSILSASWLSPPKPEAVAKKENNQAFEGTMRLRAYVRDFFRAELGPRHLYHQAPKLDVTPPGPENGLSVRLFEGQVACHDTKVADGPRSEPARNTPGAPIKESRKRRASTQKTEQELHSKSSWAFSMAGSWLLAPLLLAEALASPNMTCLSSIKVIDDFLSDAEAQAVIADLEAQRSGSERVRQEAPVLAQRLKSELRSKEQEAQLSSAVEVLEPVGTKLIHEVAGHAALERRLRETMTGKEAAQLEASKSSVPVSRKSGDVQEHADHVTHWVNGKVPGTAAVAYLESAPDGGSLGKLIFKDIADDQEVVKEVEAIAKRFISWDNSKCLHSFKAHYQGTRRLLGPLALTSYGDMVKVGIITQPTTTTTTTEEPEAPKSYYGSWKKKWWSWKKGYSGYPQSAPNLVQDGSSDTVHFMQIDKNGSHKEL
ncbi:unnamed protein product, partial [Symbiodinium microadriaticum]